MVTDEIVPRYWPRNRTLEQNTGLGHVWVKGPGLGLVMQSPQEETSQPTQVRDVDLGIVWVSVVIGALGVGQNIGQSSAGGGEPRPECHGLRDGRVKEDTQRRYSKRYFLRGGRVREAGGKPRGHEGQAHSVSRSRQWLATFWERTLVPHNPPFSSQVRMHPWPSKGTPPPRRNHKQYRI